MKQLIDKIKQEGIVLSDEALDVSSFLNMQVDANLMNEIGKAFADHYKDYDFDLLVTVEASGIAPSVFASIHAGKPLVIIKKSNKLIANKLQQSCDSFTKNNAYYLTVNQDYIQGKKIILLDDFLAMGSVVANVEALLHKANAELVSTGILISKNFQPGYQKLINEGKDLFCLAEIERLDAANKKIIFK